MLAIWTAVWSFITNPKNLFILLVTLGTFIGGCFSGKTMGRMAGYRSGYSKGYDDGSLGRRKKLFPNFTIFGEPVPEADEQEEAQP